MDDIVERLRIHPDTSIKHWEDYANSTDTLVREAADVIATLRAERDAAYRKGAEDMRERAAMYAECHSDDRAGRDRHLDWNDGYIDGCRGAAAAIRKLEVKE